MGGCLKKCCKTCLRLGQSRQGSQILKGTCCVTLGETCQPLLVLMSGFFNSNGLSLVGSRSARCWSKFLPGLLLFLKIIKSKEASNNKCRQKGQDDPSHPAVGLLRLHHHALSAWSPLLGSGLATIMSKLKMLKKLLIRAVAFVRIFMHHFVNDIGCLASNLRCKRLQAHVLTLEMFKCH